MNSERYELRYGQQNGEAPYERDAYLEECNLFDGTCDTCVSISGTQVSIFMRDAKVHLPPKQKETDSDKLVQTEESPFVITE